MGLRRTLDRRRAKEAKEVLRKHFVRRSGQLTVDCPGCGSPVVIPVPAIPKPGASIRVVGDCRCGNAVAVTLNGERRADPRGPTVGP